MTREEAKTLVKFKHLHFNSQTYELISAYANGKHIKWHMIGAPRCGSSTKQNGEPCWSESYVYIIDEDIQYRPWTLNEIPVTAYIRYKNKLNIATIISNYDGYIWDDTDMISDDNYYDGGYPRVNRYTPEFALETCEYSLNKRDWFVCGVIKS